MLRKWAERQLGKPAEEEDGFRDGGAHEAAQPVDLKKFMSLWEGLLPDEQKVLTAVAHKSKPNETIYVAKVKKWNGELLYILFITNSSAGWQTGLITAEKSCCCLLHLAGNIV
jgi:hypothetical protein